jgi:hypothetical protein
MKMVATQLEQGSGKDLIGFVLLGNFVFPWKIVSVSLSY